MSYWLDRIISHENYLLYTYVRAITMEFITGQSINHILVSLFCFSEKLHVEVNELLIP